jgi:hypothetical protein
MTESIKVMEKNDKSYGKSGFIIGQTAERLVIQLSGVRDWQTYLPEQVEEVRV